MAESTQGHWSGLDEVATVLTRFTMAVEPVVQRVKLACRDCKGSVTYAQQDLRPTFLNGIVADALRHLEQEHGGMPGWAEYFVRSADDHG